MPKGVIGGTFGVVGVSQAPVWSPLDLDWHTLWWAGDPGWDHPGDGGNVTSWPDASGNGNNGSVTLTGTGTCTYHTAGMGGSPCVVIDGTSNTNKAVVSRFFSTTLPQPQTMVMIAEHTHGSTNANFWMHGSNNGGPAVIEDAAGIRGSHSTATNNLPGPAGPALVVFEVAAGAARLRVDDAATAAVNPSSAPMDRLRLGDRNSGARTWFGAVSLAGVLPHVITDDEWAALHAWSQATYGTP